MSARTRASSAVLGARRVTLPPLIGGNAIGAKGSFYDIRIDAGNDGDIRFAPWVVPPDFHTLISARVIGSDNGAGNMRYQMRVDFAEDGEQYNANYITDAYGLTATVADDVTWFRDFSALLAGIVPGDIIGILIDRNGSDVSDTAGQVHFFGVEITYI